MQTDAQLSDSYSHAVTRDGNFLILFSPSLVRVRVRVRASINNSKFEITMLKI